MVSSSATSVDEYLAELESDRRADVEQIEDMILENLLEGYVETGKKPDMGRSCLRFSTADDLAIGLVAGTIRSTSLDEFIEGYEAARATG